MKPKRYLPLLVLLLALAGLFRPAVSAESAEPYASSPRAVLGPGSIQASVTLDAIADATVYSASPGANYGGDDTLTVSYSNIDTVQEAVSLVKFDLSGLPAGAIIDSAQLQLYLASSGGANPVTIAAFFVTGGWSEYGVTWNSLNQRKQASSTSWTPWPMRQKMRPGDSPRPITNFRSKPPA